MQVTVENTGVARPERREEGNRAGAGDVPVLLFLLAAAALLGVGAIVRRPDITANEGFLFSDQSMNLLVADHLLRGGRLYADIFSPYGPVPAYLHASVAALFGNSVSVYNLLLLGLSLVNVALAFLLLRSCVSRGIAALVVGIGLLPSFLIPGSLLGAFTASPYIPIERALLLLTALAWVHPLRRTTRRAATIGAILAFWQWVKFGGAIFGGAAVLVVDIVALALSRPVRPFFHSWLRSLLITLGVFLSGELVRVAGSFLVLSPEIALDFVWPAFHLETYDAWVTPDQRWLTWGGWRLLIGQYLTPLTGLAFGVVGLVLYARERAESPGERERSVELRLLLPTAFFILGSFAYFQQAHLFRQFMWTLVPLAALFLVRATPPLRVLVVLLWLPCLAIDAKAMLVNGRAPNTVAIRLPGGDQLWMSPATVREAEEIVSALRGLGVGGDPARGGTALVLPLGAGIHHFYDIPHPIRQPWIIPGFVRPYDEAALVRGADRLRAVVVRGGEGAALPPDPCQWRQPSAFRGPFCLALRGRLGKPGYTTTGTAVVPVLPADRSGGVESR